MMASSPFFFPEAAVGGVFFAARFLPRVATFFAGGDVSSFSLDEDLVTGLGEAGLWSVFLGLFPMVTKDAGIVAGPFLAGLAFSRLLELAESPIVSAIKVQLWIERVLKIKMILSISHDPTRTVFHVE
jgi:hypothetical protein